MARNSEKAMTALARWRAAEMETIKAKDRRLYLATEWHGEVRISELGGPNYQKLGPKMLDEEGKEVPGNRGYKYFGATKDLPGVCELFEQEPPPPPRKTRAELMKDVDADYYGYRDDDDGILVQLEREEEKMAILEVVQEWKKGKQGDIADNLEPEEEIDFESLLSDKPLLCIKAYLIADSQSQFSMSTFYHRRISKKLCYRKGRKN
ncbi:hypothetical protein QYM36_016719 [Artemia franciscana]|uniref:Uncharacterized protein n=1 Tax=Artemia franciscana TaxID=6661 RepID=A0AA88HFF0_ARTSF|nr:hypothetical protein QYM36_016719 [Artemia franciscana]